MQMYKGLNIITNKVVNFQLENKVSHSFFDKIKYLKVPLCI